MFGAADVAPLVLIALIAGGAFALVIAATR